ncbi:hypothetical protein [Gordonia aurantiaca]|uniref:hypothetical protein n=1 Tax=Gordonia sp. B21 TaxID=3151852 RepID=UPI003263BF8C
MPSPRVLTRPRKSATGLAAVAGASLALLTLTACGEGQDVTDTSASATAAVEQQAGPSTSPPVVAGRKPVSKPATSSAASAAGTSAAGGPGTECGTIPGPDGALTVTILAGDVACATAKEIGDEYGPKIATGAQHKVSDWTCGPSQLTGVLAACQKDTSVIGFAP